MSKPFDYSKWDKIELSDDEDDVHPNIDRESWFRMKHRSRVEREEREEADKKRILAEMATANQRIKELEHNLKKLEEGKPIVSDVIDDSDDDDDDDDSDDDDLDDSEGLKAELAELKKANADRQAKLDEYERNKKWNVDNICHIAEERTIVNPDSAKTKFKDGYAVPDEEPRKVKDTFVSSKKKEEKEKKEAAEKAAADEEEASFTERVEQATKQAAAPKIPSSSSSSGGKKDSSSKKVAGPEVTEMGAMLTYHEFTEKHADTVEEFMAIESFEKSKEFLIQHGDVLLQENASNYLLLASLEDEMNGYREKMRLTARQSQIISNIAELAKSLNAHPGNVIAPFFMRLEQKPFRDGFNEGTEGFIQKIIARAVKKKLEMEQERKGEKGEAVDLADIPREERLGPGGLDPLEVIETLPISMQTAFESRDVNSLKQALLQLDPREAERHMKRCIDSGLWLTEQPTPMPTAEGKPKKEEIS